MHKTTSTDDKRLQNTLKRLGVNTIPGIEEVNIFKDDDVIHFVNPKGEWDACMPPCKCMYVSVYVRGGGVDSTRTPLLLREGARSALATWLSPPAPPPCRCPP